MLKFLALFLGPVFAKEMVEMARRKRYYFNRVLYGLVLLFTLWIVWEGHHHVLRNNKVTIRVMAELAETLFHAVSGVQYGAVFLFVPLFVCGVIASEREERTLDLLFTTQLLDREIVLGKLTSRMVALVILILCALPVMSIIMLFGGVDPEGLWRIQGATLLAMLFAGAHAIYFSAITRSPMGALVRTYWWMAVYLIGIPLVTVMILSGTTSGPAAPVSRFFLAALFMINPVAPFIAAMDGFMYNQMASYAGAWFYPAAFVAPAGWSLLLLWRAVRRLRLPPSPFALFLKRLAPVRAVRGGLQPVVKACVAPFNLLQVPLRWVRNPFWLRARRARVYDREGYIGRIQWLAWLAAAFFLVLILVFHWQELARDHSSIPFLVCAWIMILTLTVILAGSSLVGDRRRGFLDLVLMSPLLPRQVIDGTLLALWQHLRRIYWLPVVLSGFFGLTGASPWAGLFCSLITATLFCALVALYGTVFSLAARTIPGALVPTFIFPVLMNFGVVFLMSVFEGGAGPVLWFLSGVCLIISWIWVRRRASPAAVGTYFIAMHLVLTAIAVCWTWTGQQHREYPIAAAHPGYLALAPLAQGQADWYHGINDSQVFVPAPAGGVVYRPGVPGAVSRRVDKEKILLACYSGALLVNFVWARWWAIRNFERLVERTDKPAESSLIARFVRRRLIHIKPSAGGSTVPLDV